MRKYNTCLIFLFINRTLRGKSHQGGTPHARLFRPDRNDVKVRVKYNPALSQCGWLLQAVGLKWQFSSSEFLFFKKDCLLNSIPK